MAIELDDGVHGIADQPAEFLFALAHLRLGAQTAQFRSRSGREDLEQCLRPRLGRHRSLVENRQMAENFSSRSISGIPM